MKKHTNLFTRIDEGMTTRRDTYLVMYTIILTALVSLGLGTMTGYWIGYLIEVR